MVSIPLEWTFKLKGGNEVKTTLNELTEAFKKGEISREQYNQALAKGNRVASQALNTERYQANLLKAQYPNLIRVSRALSTVTSISRGLLTISNALNISKIASNGLDSSIMTTQADLNALKRRRNELEAQGLQGGKEWLEVVEQIAIKEQELKEKNQQLIDQKWDNMLTSIESVFFGIGTIFTNLMNNPTIFKALTRAGTFLGGIFGGFFTLASKASMIAIDWLFPSLTGKNNMTRAGAAGSTLGARFGTAFSIGATIAMVAGAAIAWDILSEKLGGSSQLKKTTGKSGAELFKDTTGIDLLGGKDSVASKTPAEIMGQPKDHINSWQPVIDLFTKTIPDALKSTQEWFGKVFSGITDLTNSFGSNIVSGVNNIFKSLIDSMNQAILSYNKAAKKMGKSTITSLSFSPSGFTPIPMPSIKAATGFNGMVNSPTMFLAGEAGPEQVSITPNGRSSGSNTIIIHVAGSVISEKKLAYIVDQYQKQNLKSRGFTGFG